MWSRIGGEKVKLTLEEWLALQTKNVRVCAGNEDTVPKTIFIGTLQKDGTVESNVRLISATEWKKFQESWKKISGQKNPACKDYLPPQFFLFYE